MSATVIHVLSDLELLQAVEARLTPLQWTPAGGPAQSAFQRVGRYPERDFHGAFQDLATTADRAALVILDREEFETSTSGRQVKSVLSRSFLVLFSDRNWAGNVRLAMEGSATTPGVLALKALITPAVVGHLSGQTWIEPEHGELTDVRASDKAPGRLVWAASFRARGGAYTFNLPPTVMPA